MTRHIILWDWADSVPQEERTAAIILMRAELEGLVGVVPGLLELHVYDGMLASANADVVLDSTLESPEALLVYQSHPAHVRVATEIVRPRVCNRRCADFVVNG